MEEFIAFDGLRGITELRSISREPALSPRASTLEKRELAAYSIRRKLSAVSALFDSSVSRV